MSGNVRTRRRSRLSNLEKRMLVRGRLVAPDAADLSDREIARELGVSQPFVSAQRRFVRKALTHGRPADDVRQVTTRPTSLPRSNESTWADVVEERAANVRAPIFTPVGLGRMGWVRRRSSFDEEAPLREWDPFDFGSH